MHTYSSAVTWCFGTRLVCRYLQSLMLNLQRTVCVVSGCPLALMNRAPPLSAATEHCPTNMATTCQILTGGPPHVGATRTSTLSSLLFKCAIQRRCQSLNLNGVDDKRIYIEHPRNGPDISEQHLSVNNPSQCHFVYHKSHTTLGSTQSLI
jgi:hypothetical protein